MCIDYSLHQVEVEIVGWVNGLTINAGFEVEMGTGDVTGSAHGCNHLALADGVANRYGVGAEVSVAGHKAAWMLDVDAVAIGVKPRGTDDGTALSCIDWRAGWACNIHA